MLIDEIKAKSDKFDTLRLRKTVINHGRQDITYFFVSNAMLSDEEKALITEMAVNSTTDRYDVFVKFSSDTLTPPSITDFITKFLSANHPSVLHRITGNFTVRKQGGGYAVSFTVDKLTESIMESMEIIKRLDEYFKQISAIPVQLVIDAHPLNTDVSELKLKVQQYQQLRQGREISRPKRYVEVENVEAYIGKAITSRAKYISDLTEPQRKYTVAGKVGNPRVFTSEKTSSKICKFTVTDYTGTIQAVMFAKSDAEKKFSNLHNGDEIITSGQADRNSYSGDIELKVFDISRCTVKPLSNQPKYGNDIPTAYTVVKPKISHTQKQLNLYEQGNAVPAYLEQNDVVALTVLATGSRVMDDKIYKVVAVKMRQGMVIESFSTYVNPEVTLDETLIKEKNLKKVNFQSAPVFFDIIPDLYKFCANAVIVTINAEVSMGFVAYYAKHANYYFANKVIDFEQLVTALTATKQFAKVKFTSYAPDVVADKLGVKTDEAAKSPEALICLVVARIAQLDDKLLENA